MNKLTDTPDYRISQKIIHWLMALLIMLDLFVAQKFGRLMELADRVESRTDHAQIGVIVTVLFIIRVILRIKHGAPPIPDGMSRLATMGAKIGHHALYWLIGCLIVTGMLSAINAASSIAPFGLFQFGDGIS